MSNELATIEQLEASASGKTEVVEKRESLSSGIRRMLLQPASADLPAEGAGRDLPGFESIYELARDSGLTLEDYVRRDPKGAVRRAEAGLAAWQNVLTQAAMTGALEMPDADGKPSSFTVTKNQTKLLEMRVKESRQQLDDIRELVMSSYSDEDLRKDALEKSMYRRALRGDSRLAVYLHDRVDGRPAESKQVEVDYDNAYNVYAIIHTLFKEQLAVFNSGNGTILICCSRRAGKCWAPGTLLRRYDGSVVKVEDVRVGDVMMGADGMGQRVTSLASGRDMMWRVKANKSGSRMEFKCNSVHVLTVKFRGDLSKTRSAYKGVYKKGEIYDIPLNEFIKLPKGIQEKFVLWRQRTDYEPVHHVIDPYILGLWIGDGDKKNTCITCNTADTDIVDAIKDYCDRCGFGFKSVLDEHGIGKSFRVYISAGNLVRGEMRRLNLMCNKHIPKEYLIDSIENRLNLLAGLIDSDGYYNPKKNTLEYYSTDKVIINDVLELCDSLGFKTVLNSKQVKYWSEAHNCEQEATSYSIYIKGDRSIIPNRCSRKHAADNEQDTGYRFTVEPVGFGDYYGFTLDGDGRCLLADYTVTHNTRTLVAMLLVESLLKPRTKCMYIGETMELSENLVRSEMDKIIDECNLRDKRGKRLDWKHLDNGSEILIRGLSNTKDPDQIRGQGVKVIVIDEFFHLRSELLEYMQREVLTPMQMDYADGYKFICAGTPPRVKGTYGEKAWREWDVPHFKWTWEQNPHPVDVELRRQFIEKELREKGVDWDSSFARREYLGEWAYDDDLLLYPEYHCYDKREALPTIQATRILIGIDYGVSDNDCIWGCVWNDDEQRGFQFWEDKFNRLDIMGRGISQLEYLGEQVKACWLTAMDYFPDLEPKEANKRILWDADDNDQHLTDYLNINVRLEDHPGLKLNIANAHKTDRAIMYDRIRDVLRKGDMLVIKGGKCEQELESTILKRGPNGEVYKEVDSKAYHPDLLPAMRYAMWNCVGVA